jgi:hypothetical protein
LKLSEDGTILIRVDTADISSEGHFEIPDTITKIARGVFKGCVDLKQIIFPENLTEIEGWAFEGCTSLTDVTLPDSLMEIEGGLLKDAPA